MKIREICWLEEVIQLNRFFIHYVEKHCVMIWTLSKSINTIYFSHKLNNFLMSTDTYNAVLNYFQSNLGSESLPRKQSNIRLSTQLLSIGFVPGWGHNSFKVLWAHGLFYYCNIVIEVIVLSDRGSKDIIKVKKGTLEMLRIKNNNNKKPPLCNMKNSISVLFHSCCKGYCASLRNNEI